MTTSGLLQRLLCLLVCTVVLFAGRCNPSFAQSPAGSDAVRADVYDVYTGGRHDRQEHIVFLHDPAENRLLPIWIGKCEADAISRKLYNQSFPRPLTHDLFQSVLRDTGIRITSILVDQLRPLTESAGTSTYFAILTLQKSDGASIRIDSRPSDAMALAVRMDLPVYVSREIFDQNSVQEESMSQLPSPPAQASGSPSPPPVGNLTSSSAKDTVRTEVYNVGLDTHRQHIVFLHDPAENRLLPIRIGECEALAILRKLHKNDFPRPLTHDLFQSVLRDTGVRITSILVDEPPPLPDGIENGDYLAILTLQKSDGASIRIDSRPDDAMALAVRMNLPVYVSRKVLDRNSIPEEDGPQKPSPPKEKPTGYY